MDMIAVSNVGLQAAIDALAEETHDDCGWFSDGQQAQPHYDETMQSVEFCGYGSIDLHHVADLVIRAYLKEATNL